MTGDLFSWGLRAGLGAVVILAGSIVVCSFLRKLTGRSLRRDPAMDPLPDNGPGDGLYYGFCFIRYLLMLMLGGSLAGLALYLLVGPWIRPDLELAFLASKGVVNGLFFVGLVWGPGIALVGCFVHARKQFKMEGSADE